MAAVDVDVHTGGVLFLFVLASVADCEKTEESVPQFISLLLLNQQQRRTLGQFSKETLNFVKFGVCECQAHFVFHPADQLF